MGILKAAGFTAGRVLGMLAVENSLLGLLAGVLGMGAVAVAMALVNAWRPAAQLSLDPGLAGLMDDGPGTIQPCHLVWPA